MTQPKNILDSLLATTRKEDLQTLVEAELHDVFEVTSIAVAPKLNPGSPEFRRQMLFSGEQEIMEIWMERRMYAFDPLYTFSVRPAQEPYYFKDLMKTVKPNRHTRLVEALRAEHGRLSGYMCTLQGGTVSMGSPADQFHLSPAQLKILETIAQPLLNHTISLSSSEATTLELEPYLKRFLYLVDENIRDKTSSETRRIVCQSMGISESTYRTYWQRIREVLDTRSQEGALLIARDRHLLPPGK